MNEKSPIHKTAKSATASPAYGKATQIWTHALNNAMALAEGGDQLSSYASNLWKLFSCPRRCYWDRVDPIAENSQRYYADASLGNVCHEWVVDHYKKAGMWRGDEVRGGNARLNISYRIDVLIMDPYTGAVVPVEIKSQHRDKFDEVVASGAPVDAHLLQFMSYLHFHRPAPYEYGYIHYICRNRGETLVFKVRYDPELGQLIESNLAQFEADVLARRLPPKGQDCHFCPYAKRCQEVKE